MTDGKEEEDEEEKGGVSCKKDGEEMDGGRSLNAIAWAEENEEEEEEEDDKDDALAVLPNCLHSSYSLSK